MLGSHGDKRTADGHPSDDHKNYPAFISDHGGALLRAHMLDLAAPPAAPNVVPLARDALVLARAALMPHAGRPRCDASAGEARVSA